MILNVYSFYFFCQSAFSDFFACRKVSKYSWEFEFDFEVIKKCDLWLDNERINNLSWLILMHIYDKWVISDCPKIFHNFIKCTNNFLKSNKIYKSWVIIIKYAYLLIFLFQGEFLLLDNLELVTEVEFGGLLL